MASGTIYGTTSNEYIECKIEWSSTANTASNTSNVYARLYYRRTNSGYTTYGKPNFNLYIGGNVTSSTQSMVEIDTAWVEVVSAAVSVFHNSDGTGSVKIQATGGITGTSLVATNCSQTVTLDTIARESLFNRLHASTEYFTGIIYTTYTPRSDSFYHKCDVSLNLNGSLISIASTKLGKGSAGVQKVWGLPLNDDRLSTIYNRLPNATKGTLRVTLRTYSDSGYSKEVGDGEYQEITLSIPNDATTQPTVGMSVSPLSDLSSPYNSLYLQGLSRVKANLTTSAKYGATIVASNITVNGKSYGSPYESDILSQDGKISVKATVKDSRGFYGTYYQEIDVIPYSQPYIRAKSGESEVVVARCDGSASLTESGTYLKIKAKAVYSKVVDSTGNQHNYGFIKFRWRQEGGTYSAWQTILDCEKDKSDEVITPPLLSGNLLITTNYQVQVVATDDLYDSVPITVAIPSASVYMDRPVGGKSMGLGGYAEGDGNLDVYWNIKARDGLSLFDAKGDEIPLGTTLPLPRDQIKGAWNPDNLECGVHVVANNNALKQGDTVIMYNGVLIQMAGTVGSNVKIQLAFPTDTNRSPMYRLCWYNTWADWRSLKL